MDWKRTTSASLRVGGAWLMASAVASAAGVVGTGTPGSCTEAALNTALAGGGTVTFNCGGAVVIPITSQKVIASATTVDGGNAALVTLDGGGTSRHFTTNQAIALTLRNLTLRNGRCPIPDPGQPSPGFGGSIRSGILSPLTITDSVFQNNVCDAAGNDVGGGAIRQRRGVLIVQRTTFTNNRGGNGGAISGSDSPITIEDSTFTGNTTNAHTTSFSGVGGAIYVDGSGGGQIVLRRVVVSGNSSTFQAGGLHTFHYAPDQGLYIENSTFAQNSTVENGGGVFHQAGPLTIVGTTFDANQTIGTGGGLYIVDSPVAITNSTFSGNQAVGTVPNSGASGNGGAIMVFGFQAAVSGTLSHLTIAGNHADWVGGGISGSGNLSLTLRGSIVADNTVDNPSGIAKNCSIQLANGGGNVQFPAAGTGSFDPNCTSAILVASPQLSPLANNGGLTRTRAIASASPARNLVSSGCPPPATDQRGVARPANACDSGAYELSTTVSIGGVTVTEGTGGTTNAVFPVTLSESSGQTVTVAFSTSNGSASAGSDYTATSGTVTFPAGTTSRTATVPVLGDTLDEDDESFLVTLSSPVNAAVGTAQATGTITDDDAAPNVSVSNCTAAETTGTNGVCAFDVSLSAASGKTASVSFSTANGTAVAGTDFVAASGVVTFPPGSTQRSVGVTVTGDAIDELDETFTLNLATPVNAGIADGQGVATIDDDDGPGVSVSDVVVTEGNAGTSTSTFTATLSAPSVQQVTVAYATSDGTATAGSDYVATSGTLTFPAGMTSRTFGVTVNGDTADEPNEAFVVTLSGAVDAGLADPQGLGRILDDDGGAVALRELGHGDTLVDDLAGGADLFVVLVPPRTSWEAVVDSASGDVGGASGVALERVAADATTVVQSSVAVGVGRARSLRWENANAASQVQYVRVRSTQCSTDCGADDRYRIRVRETTGRLPRFNCANGQVSVFMVQNRTSSPRSGTARFWSPNGGLLGQTDFDLAGRASSTTAVCGLPGLSGQTGSISVTHDGGFADLEGKAVSLDPVNAFSFDTLMTLRR